MTTTRRRWRAIQSYVLAAVVGLGVWGVFAYRASTTTSRSNRLCGVIAGFVVASDKTVGTPGTRDYQYYQRHPEALRQAHRVDAAILEYLGCMPVKIILPK